MQNDVELLHVYEKYGQDKVYSGIILGVPPPHDGSKVDGDKPGAAFCDGSKVDGDKPDAAVCDGILLPSWGGGTPNRIYIPELKLLTKLKSAKELPMYSLVECTVHLFLDEVKMSKKVRLQIL